MSSFKVIGLNTVLAKLNEEVRKIGDRTLDGMIEGGFIIQRAAQELTPVNTGNLRASAFVIWEGSSVPEPKWRRTGRDGAALSDSQISQLQEAFTGAIQAAKDATKGTVNAMGMRNPTVAVGFGAAYALFVHEDMEASHMKKNKKGEDVQVGQAKFLQLAIQNTQGQVLSAIERRARIS